MKKVALGIFVVICIALVGILFNDFQVSNNVLLANIEALANPEDSKLWFRQDVDCEYTFKGEKGTSFSITIGGVSISGKYDSKGEYKYKISKGATHCTSGGHEQCTARYCPVL